MPFLISEQDPQPDPTRDQQALAALPASGTLGMSEAAGGAMLTGKAAGFIGSRLRDLLQTPEQNPTLEPDQANALYGLDGYLKFERPVSQADAAFQSSQAHERAYRETVLSNTKAGPLQIIGSSLAGGLVDPVGLPLWLAPELTVGKALRGAWAVGKAGRLANAGREALLTGLEGAAGASLYEGTNFGLSTAAGDEYDLGAGLTNIVLGGVLGASLGGLHGALDVHDPLREVAPAAPRAVDEMTDTARLGAMAQAVDTMASDRAVNLGDMVEAEAAAPKGLEHLDERPEDVADGGDMPGRRIREDVAVTTRGTEVPVAYALVEMRDLITSHTDDLTRNPVYPGELQPRQRDRAGAQARNLALESELNPRRLMFDTGAETGAPIVSPDGVLESGNGRTIALRRSAAKDGEAWQSYRAELERQGLDASGMDKPVLVRIRTQAMSGDERAALAREMNADVTERLSAPEQAMADAAGIDDAMLAHLDGTPEGERRFARNFLSRVASDQQNAFTDAGGQLSAEGGRRLKAALVARAYQDPSLVSALYEQADPNIRTIGAALGDAAPGWAQMRAAAARGDIPPALDLTANLRAAVDLVRYARDNKIPVDELILSRLGQTEMFGGEAISPETEALLRMFFRDEAFRRHRSADKIAWALKDYARQALEVRPGPNLFGETPDGEGQLILKALADRFRKDEPFPEAADLADLADRQAAGAAGEGVRPDAGGRGGSLLQPEGGGETGSPGQGGRGGPERPAAAGQEGPGRSGSAGVEVPPPPKLAGNLVSDAKLIEQLGKDGDAESLREAIDAYAAPEVTGRRTIATQADVLVEYAKDVLAAVEARGGVQEAAAGQGAAERVLAHDPELKALHEDTEALAAEAGLEPATPHDDPNTIAEAIRAAALCLSVEEGG